MESRKILGVDPGMRRLGLAVVELNPNGKLILLTHGLIHNPRGPEKWGEYLNNSIEEVLVDFSRFLGLTNPDIICSERVPPGRLQASSELVFSAITVCKVLAYQWNIPWYDLAANTIKETVTGDDKATKAKVKNAVTSRYPRLAEHHKKLREDQKKAGEKVVGLYPDVYDAVATALCGANKIYEANLNEREIPDSA